MEQELPAESIGLLQNIVLRRRRGEAREVNVKRIDGPCCDLDSNRINGCSVVLSAATTQTWRNKLATDTTPAPCKVPEWKKEVSGGLLSLAPGGGEGVEGCGVVAMDL